MVKWLISKVNIFQFVKLHHQANNKACVKLRNYFVFNFGQF